VPASEKVLGYAEMEEKILNRVKVGSDANVPAHFELDGGRLERDHV